MSISEGANGGGYRVGFGRVYRGYGGTIPFFQCFTVSFSSDVGRFVPEIMMVERWAATGD
jgi:hypothetical protein